MFLILVRLFLLAKPYQIMLPNPVNKGGLLAANRSSFCLDEPSDPNHNSRPTRLICRGS
jgi:hypothetical protein